MSDEGVKREVERLARYVKAERDQARAIHNVLKDDPHVKPERAAKARKRVVLLNNIDYWMGKALEDVARLFTAEEV